MTITSIDEAQKLADLHNDKEREHAENIEDAVGKNIYIPNLKSAEDYLGKEYPLEGEKG